MLCSSTLSFRPLILYLCALSSQWTLATATPLDSREEVKCYITATKEVTIEEVFTFTVDITTPSSTAPTSGGVFFAEPSSSIHTVSPVADSTIESSPISTLSASEISSALSTLPSASSGYVFNSHSTENVAVYFGQTAATSGTSLAKQCADPNIDIVILAFVISRNDSGGPYPGVNFGAACGGQTSLMEEEAPGLLSCPDLAADIDTCQTTYGKKVLLSIGGGGQSIIFNTASDASAFGGVIWDLFGPSGNIEADLRPFGDVSIDGFDIDNEDNNNAYYEVLGSTLRGLYSSSTSKEFYLSAAPQCPNPDASDPTALLLLCDFVWVQFYNNPPCSIGTSGFTASLQSWSETLSSSQARLYLGAPAWSGADETTYEKIGTAQGMEAIAQNVSGMGLANFGGVMFWDGPEGMLNEGGGKDIIAWAKTGLTM